MSQVFADTSYFVALHNRRDSMHALAVALESQTEAMDTTDFVLIEVSSFFCRPGDRNTFATIDAHFARQPTVSILPASTELYERGKNLFAARPDKEWSLTDCISFEVMTELALTDALPSDHHFEQAGFRVLLKP